MAADPFLPPGEGGKEKYVTEISADLVNSALHPDSVYDHRCPGRVYT